MMKNWGKKKHLDTKQTKKEASTHPKEYLVNLDLGSIHEQEDGFNSSHQQKRNLSGVLSIDDAGNNVWGDGNHYNGFSSGFVVGNRPRKNTYDSGDSFLYESEEDLGIIDEEGDEQFDLVKLTISPVGGMLTLEYPREESPSATDSLGFSCSSTSSSSVGSLSTLETLEMTENDLELDEIEPEFDIVQEEDDEEELRFPLTNTNVHRLKSSNPIEETIEAWKIAFPKKKKDTIIPESYQIVPDIGKNPSKEGELLKSSKMTKNNELKQKQNKKSDVRETNEFKDQGPWEDQTRISKLSSSNSCTSSTHTSKTIKIQLRPEDEIHASPCQCALNLVGLVSASPTNYDTTSSTSNITIGSRSTDEHPYKITSSKVDTVHHTRLVQNSAMVRTASGQAYREKSSTFIPTESAEQHQITLGGPVHSPARSLTPNPKKRSCISIFPKMSSPGMFSALHEVTLIRSSVKNSRNNFNALDEIQWKAVTIQCSDHDEMDLLIQTLRDSAKSKVVPFSTDPKSKLRRRRQMKKKRPRRVASKSLSSFECHEIVRHSRKNSTSSIHPSSKHLFHKRDYCEICNKSFTLLHRRHHCRKCFRSCCSSCSSIHADHNEKHARYCKSCKSVNFSLHKKPGNRFHNTNYCELCTLHFTLFTRRHHCRKCDHSCCSNCSSIIMIKGGKLTRYCNRCNNKIRNFSPANPNGALPGKVHVECNTLGVGVIGKIPHWINFMNFDDTARPAVARLTIELMEAIALPTLDFYGETDPYVRATITGYDYDLKWNLVEWFPHKRFSLCGIYCSGTTSPLWLGPGRHGGELLTLPVLRTAGAVLRLEVLHYDVMTNSKGKDNVLGVVEIPLADIPNANLRDSPVMKQKGCKAYDGFVDRWYQLESPLKKNKKGVMLSTPMDDPTNKIPSIHSSTKIETHGLPSWQEVGQKTQALFVAPIDWISSVLNLDIPKRPTVNEYHRRSQSAAIHVRLKLNASEVGDLLSHSWFPLVQPKPDILPFDPQTLWSSINSVLKELDPYLKAIKFCEDILKWKHSPTTCTAGYLVVAFHILFIQQLPLFIHFYLLVFLSFCLKRKPTSENTLEYSKKTIKKNSSFDSSTIDKQSLNDSSEHDDSSSNESKANLSQSLEYLAKNSSNKVDREAHLNKTLSWIAKILGENRGLEHVQHKLANILHDIRNLNSLWDGTSTLKTKVTIVCVTVSFLLHFCVSRRLLWLVGTALFHFSKSPWIIRKCRMIFGFHRGFSQIVRRRQLHFIELNQVQKGTFKVH